MRQQSWKRRKPLGSAEQLNDDPSSITNAAAAIEFTVKASHKATPLPVRWTALPALKPRHILFPVPLFPGVYSQLCMDHLTNYDSDASDSSESDSQKDTPSDQKRPRLLEANADVKFPPHQVHARPKQPRTVLPSADMLFSSNPEASLAAMQHVVSTAAMERPPNYNGRVRSFIHVEGDFPTLLMIPVDLPPDTRTSLALQVEKVKALMPDLITLISGSNATSHAPAHAKKVACPRTAGSANPQAPLHISLSRTVAIRYHQIQVLTEKLRKALQHVPRLQVTLKGLCTFVNEDRSRTFLSAPVVNDGVDSLKSSLCAVIKLIDAVFAQQGLKCFYKDPHPHISVAWMLGDKRQQLEEALKAVCHPPPKETGQLEADNEVEAVLGAGAPQPGQADRKQEPLHQEAAVQKQEVVQKLEAVQKQEAVQQQEVVQQQEIVQTQEVVQKQEAALKAERTKEATVVAEIRSDHRSLQPSHDEIMSLEFIHRFTMQAIVCRVFSLFVISDDLGYSASLPAVLQADPKPGGKIKCWGNPGLTAAGEFIPSTLPYNYVYVDLGTNRTATFITSGGETICAILDNGLVKCFHNLYLRQVLLPDQSSRLFFGDDIPYLDLGIGRTAKKVIVPLLKGGGYVDPSYAATAAGNRAVCVILDNNELKCQSMASIQVQAGYPDEPKYLPPMANIPAVNFGSGCYATTLSFGQYHACAILDNGDLKCWGNNEFGQVGNKMFSLADISNTGDLLPPVDLGTGRTAIAISCGRSSSCAILDNGHLKCWGSNFVGETGQGNGGGAHQNDPSDNMPAVDLGTGRRATSISVGWSNVCAILDNGDVKCWGANELKEFEYFDNPKIAEWGALGLGSTMTAVGADVWDMGDNLLAVDIGTGRTPTSIVNSGCHYAPPPYEYKLPPYGNESPPGGSKDFGLEFEFEVDFGDYDYDNDNSEDDYNFGVDNDDTNDYESGYEYDEDDDGNSFDPSVNPRIEFRLLFPGGQAKFLRDLRKMLAPAAQVPSTNVILTSIPSSGRRLFQSAGAEVSAVVWFGANYEDVPSEISGKSAFELFELRLRKSPIAIFGASTSSNIDATMVQVSDIIVYNPTGGTDNYYLEDYYTSVFVDYDDYITVIDFDFDYDGSRGYGYGYEYGGDYEYTYYSSAEDLLASARLEIGGGKPVIERQGEPYVEIPEWNLFSYEDEGALLIDFIDGTSFAPHTIFLCQRVDNIEELAYFMEATQLLPILNCFKSMSKVDVSRPAVTSEVFVILYAGRNSQGTAAAPALRVVALSRRITLLGTGRSALSSTGETVMIDEIPFDFNWEDTGATAIGYPYGNPVDITASVTSFGAGAVNTLLATPPSETHSFVITYTALDEVGNEAAPARRLIKVNCIPPSKLCFNPNNGRPTCTVDGFCGLPPSLTRQTVTTLGATHRDPNAPNLTLGGPPVMTIPQGTGYSRCPKDAPVGSLCDAGATAEDLYDGPLTQNVKVCGYPFFKNARSTSRLVPILLACNITTRYPGTFKIKFSVTNSAGFTLRTERTLVVESVCLPGSRLCNNLVDCSVRGYTCESELAVTDFGGSVEVLRPIISLVTYPFLGESIEVKRGTPYAFCNGTIPTTDQLCEPWALAFEFSLAGVNATLEDANNVTQHIVACPRPDCLVGAPCSKVDLGAMSLVNRGLGGCAIDTLAPVGSIFPVAFWVWDYSVPSMSAVVVRKVVISEPCPDPAEPIFCRDGSRFYCSPSDCRTSQVYLPDPTEVPAVKLLPLDTATVFIELGNVPPFSLAPCPSLSQNSSCGAVAYTKYLASPVIVQDLTDKIKVTSTTNCKDNPSNCRGCTLTQMSLGGGLCLAGTYKLRYSITFQLTGVTRHVEQTVIIYNTSYSDFPGTRVYDSLTNYSLAVNVVDAINSGNMSRSEFMQAQSRVATAVLPQLSLRDANVELFNATLYSRLNPPPPDPVRVHDVYADIRIHKYTPSTMDLGKLTVFNAALAVAAASENKNHRMMVENDEWEKQVQAIQTKDGMRRASRLMHIVEVHGWMALADTDWLMQQTHNLDTNNDPSPWDMYLSEEASPAMPLYSVVNEEGSPMDSNELGQPYLAEQQMVMDKSDTIMSLVGANIDALTNLVIQASATATVLRDTIAETVAASDQNIRESLLVQAFNARNDPDVPSIVCFQLTQQYTRSFVINTYGQYTDTTNSIGTGGHRRKMLQTQESNSEESARSWYGYFLGAPSEFSTLDDEEWSKALANRYVGMKNNRIIGGLLLHTTRMVDDADCSTDSLSNRLDAACSINSLRSTLSSNGASDELLDQLFATDAERSYGIDPVFLRSSTLYDTSLLDQYDLYYNTSSGSEVGPNGVPLGFRWRNMKGYENGFPVLFENRMQEEQAANVMQYLMDGNYLDYKTKGLTAEILSYNRDLHVLGYARGNFKWMLDGSIQVAWEFLGLPALDYLRDSDNTLKAGLKVFGKELVALWILIGFFTFYTIWYLVDCIRYYGRAEASDPAGLEWSLKRGLRALPTDSKLIYDILLVTAMVSGGVVWSLYMGKYAMKFEARYTYNVYDSVAGKANWLLPIRKDAAFREKQPWNRYKVGRLLTQQLALTTICWIPSTSQLHGVQEWQEANTIAMTVCRLISSFSFQHRLGLIGDILVRAMPLLFHIFLLFLVVLLMFAVAVYIMLGWRRVEVATYKDALQDTFLSLVDYSRMQDTTNAFFADSHSFKTLVASDNDDTPHGLIVLPIEHFVVGIMSIFSFFYVQNVLLIFLLAHLLNVFSRLKSELSNGNTIGSSGSVLSDLKLTVFPSMWIQLQRLFWKPAVAVTGASRRKLSHHPDADDGDTWDGPTTKEEARPKTLEELCKLMSDSILQGVNQHHGAMQQVKGVRVGDVLFIDERMTQALLIATALEMEKKKKGVMKKKGLVDSQYQQVLIHALEAATELHTSRGHTLHVPLRDLVQGPTFAIQNNGRPIAEGIEADEEAGIDYPVPPNTVVLRKPDKDNRRIGSTAIPLENDKVATSSDSPVEVFHSSSFSLKKSPEIESLGDGLTPANRLTRASRLIESLGDGLAPAKYLHAVGFPGQTTVAWEGPLKQEELMGLTVPRTVTQVPFLQLPEQTLMQILEEGFPDPRASHWPPKSEVPRLMNVALQSEHEDNLLQTRNQLFNMLVSAVVASARSQRLVAEWQVKSWDETRVAVEHNFLLVRHSDISVSSQDASAYASSGRFPSLHTPTSSPRLADLEAAIEVLEQDRHLSWHSSMNPATTKIDPDLAGLWPDMMKVFDGEGLHPRRRKNSTHVDSENQNSHFSPRSKLSSSTAQLLLSSDDGGMQSKPSSPRADARLGQSVSFAKDPLHTPQCGGGWNNAKSFVPLENDKAPPWSDSPVEVSRDSICSLDLSSMLESFRAGNTLETDPQAVISTDVSRDSNCRL
eukprot:gene4363-14486_t